MGLWGGVEPNKTMEERKASGQKPEPPLSSVSRAPKAKPLIIPEGKRSHGGRATASPLAVGVYTVIKISSGKEIGSADCREQSGEKHFRAAV